MSRPWQAGRRTGVAFIELNLGDTVSVFTDSAYSARLRSSCFIAVSSLLLVAVIIVAGRGTVLTKTLLILPFVMVAPGLVLGWYRSYSWLSLLILLYFIIAVTRAMSPTGNWLDALYLTLTVLIFLAATFSSRWLQQAQLKNQGT